MKLRAALWLRLRCKTFGLRSFPRKRESTFSCPGRAKRDPGPRAVASGLWVPAFRGDERSKQQTPLIPAQAGIQGQGLGPRFRGDERKVWLRLLWTKPSRIWGSRTPTMQQTPGRAGGNGMVSPTRALRRKHARVRLPCGVLHGHED